MRIIAAAGEFTLPADFEAELSRYNVLLTDAGEQTAPITLPPTPENLRLVNWSNRLDAFYKPLTDLDVLVIDGLMHRKANLGIHTADEEEGISCTLYFGTAEFYSRAGETKLNALPWTSFTYTAPNATAAQKLAYVIGTMKARYASASLASDWVVVPLATTQEFEYEYVKPVYNSTPITLHDKRFFILNGFDSQQGIDLTTGSPTKYIDTFLGERLQYLYQDSNRITLPLGYGMSPFLKTSYVLEFIFSHFGFTVNTTALEAVVPEYHDKSFVANNVADAICDGIINYKHLVPNVTVKEFIQHVETRFGGKIMIDETSKTATFLLLEQQLYTGNADMDITPYLASKVKKGDVEFKEVKVVDTGAIGADTQDTDKTAEIIEIETAAKVDIRDVFRPLNAGFDFNVTFNFPTITDIVHLKSEIIVKGKTVKETAKASSNIILLQRLATYTEVVKDSFGTVYKLRYYPSAILFGERGVTPLIVTNAFYTRFKAFRQFSNIPLTATLKIPDKELAQLNIYLPKKLQGQFVMIEKMVGSTKPGSLQNVSFRTLRPFADRE